MIEINTVIRVSLSDAINNDLEGWLDFISEEAGHLLLMDIDYKIIGHDDQTLLLQVSGFVEEEEYD